jgi:hypothetical protein
VYQRGACHVSPLVGVGGTRSSGLVGQNYDPADGVARPHKAKVPKSLGQFVQTWRLQLDATALVAHGGERVS